MTIETFFQHASKRSRKQLAPHALRAWVNTVLATRGIDKQLRDLYLGHSCSYEAGYIMQLISKWQQTFKQETKQKTFADSLSPHHDSYKA